MKILFHLCLFYHFLFIISARKNSESEVIFDHVVERAIKQSEWSEYATDRELLFSSALAPPYLENKMKCARKLSLPGLEKYRLTVIGSMDPPVTLVLAIGKNLQSLMYQFLSDWCTSNDRQIRSILSHSTMIFLTQYDVKHREDPCIDIRNVSFVEKVLLDIHSVMKYNLVIMFASGGVKIRYMQPNSGFAGSLARKYQENHPIMQRRWRTEACGMPSVYRSVYKGLDQKTVGKLTWSNGIQGNKQQIKFLNGLLIQVSCCYEELMVRYQYEENRRSLIEMMKMRTTGIILDSTTTVNVVPNTVSPVVVMSNRRAFIHMPLGESTVNIYKRATGKLITTFKVNFNSSHYFERRRV